MTYLCTRCSRSSAEPRRAHGERLLCDACAAEPPLVDPYNAPLLPSTPLESSDSNGVSRAVARRVTLTPASAITPARVRWLDRGRIPLDGVTVAAGEPGLGKSTWTGALLPAQVSRGLLDGDLHGPRDVLIASAEDSWAAVIVPRLMAAGADLERVHRITVHDNASEETLTLPDDIAQLEAECVRLREEGRPVALLVVDPIGAFLSGSIDSHRDASVRRALAPLASLAERERLAVTVVAHINKDAAQKMLSRITGSSAFGAAARSVVAFARDPEDPDGEHGTRRVVVHVKSNWGKYAPTLAAHVESRLVDLPNGDVADVGLLVVTGESDVGPEGLQGGREDTDSRDVEEAIVAVLADGARPSREVKATVASELDCSRKTVQRAAVRMREAGELNIEESGFPRTTTWTLITVGTPLVSPLWGHEPVPTVPGRILEPETEVSHVSADTSPGAVLTESTEEDLARAERLLAEYGGLNGAAPR